MANPKVTHGKKGVPELPAWCAMCGRFEATHIIAGGAQAWAQRTEEFYACDGCLRLLQLHHTASGLPEVVTRPIDVKLN